MDLEATKKKVEDLQGSLEGVLEIIRAFGFDNELLAETEGLLEDLLGHIQVLQHEKSLDVLESELKKTSKTLDKLRANLQSYPEPNEELIAEVDEAQKEVDKNLVKTKVAKGAKSALPFVLIGGAVALAISRRR